MSCSARIPVYVLLISMFVPDSHVLGVFNLQGLVMTGMYFLGFFMALAVAWVIKTVGRYTSSALFVTEIPIYRIPRWKNILLTMYLKSRTFVVEAGKVILVISMVLWFLKTYGPSEQMEGIATAFKARLGQATTEAERIGLKNEEAAAKLQASYAGMLGHSIEPVIRPLGFDWKIGISLLSSFAAREVFVGTMATLYSAGEGAAEDAEGKFEGLRRRMQAETRPGTGEPVYTTAVAISLLVFYAFAMQCMSTLAVVRRETASWKMTLWMLLYMTGLAYGASLLVYQLAG
jgi:ferrous iron transport protein B